MATTQQPDDLMNHFQGRSLKTIIIFTIIVHLVIILGTSVPYFIGMFGDPNKGLSEEERTQIAVKEANETLARIAKSHGLQAQQLRSQMAGGASRPKPAETTEGDTAAPPTTEGDTTPPAEGEIRGNSEVEQALQQKLDPPKDLPPVNNTDDLFK